LIDFEQAAAQADTLNKIGSNPVILGNAVCYIYESNASPGDLICAPQALFITNSFIFIMTLSERI